MAGQQPRFLTQLIGNRKGSVGDPRSKKRKAPDTEKDSFRTKNKGNLTIKTTQKQASTSLQPSFVIPTIVVIPSSHTNFSSPPPSPLPLTRVPRPILWESGVGTTLSTAIHPPDRFFDSPPYNEATLQELQIIELNALKAAAVTQALASVQSKYGNVIDELHVCQEEKNKTYEEFLKVKEDYKNANRDLLSLQQSHAMNVKSLQDFKVMYESLEKKLQEKEGALLERSNALENTRKELEEAEKKAKDTETDVDNCRVALSESMEGSFQNALTQIKFLNPDIELNLFGLHHLSYVSDGQLMPHPPSSPAADSITQVKGADEDAMNVDNSVDSRAEA